MIDERIIKLALDFLLKFPDEGMNILNSERLFQVLCKHKKLI